ncbi:hypothetical protein DY000_02031077 [Brassica cretica]|uniref:Uncharacterized protein n=1 Tax=Brassica cretica TaxID=69181 RepID=A0ABQ7DRY3_BRACR|nr:hypothetical protein DY000_02031077 [Brassica cretica]
MNLRIGLNLGKAAGPVGLYRTIRPCQVTSRVHLDTNFLFWKRKEVAALLKPRFDTFPWICWYICKARNDKLFNGKVVSPLDIQHASLEAECWRKVNEKEEADEDHDDLHTTAFETVSPWIPQIPTCQIDLSLIDNGSFTGLGWSLMDQMDSESFGPMYERHEDNLDMLRDGLLRPSGHDYELDRLANIRDRERGVLKSTGGF